MKMKYILLITTILVVVICADEDLHPQSDEFIDIVNSKATTWKAGRNFHQSIPFQYLKNLLGVDPAAYQIMKPRKHVQVLKNIPEEFDARVEWPNCPTIDEISDQGGCGSCWAVSATGAMSDRVCIASKAKSHIRFSATDLLTCCGVCGDGCNGGNPAKAWDYWVSDGIVSGGPYDSNQGCKPYVFEPHGSSVNVTPPCVKECEPGYSVPYKKDLYRGKLSYVVASDPKQIQTEIMTNGPVVAGFQVYKDFYSYKTGVYEHVWGELWGHHAIRILGWGTLNNTAYWLCANSWGTCFGLSNGLFKIRRGSNHCGIEGFITAGLPAIN